MEEMEDLKRAKEVTIMCECYEAVTIRVSNKITTIACCEACGRRHRLFVVHDVLDRVMS